MQPRIEVVTAGELIVVHEITVNYNQRPAEAIEGLPNNSLIANKFDPAKWNGGKSGVVDTLRLHRRGAYLSTPDARQFVRDKGDVPCVPAEIAPLGEIWRTLWDAGVQYVPALCESDDQLWRGPDRHLRVVYLNCNPDYHGFNLNYADNRWNENDWFAGLPPQLSSFSRRRREFFF